VAANEFRALLGPARSWAAKAALAAVFAAALPTSYYLYRHGFLLSFDEWIKAQGAAGVFTFAIGYVVIAVFLLAPSELMWTTAGAIFGAWGAPLVIVASVIEALVVFLLSRHVLRPKVRLLLAERPLLSAIDAAIGSQSWQVAILLRLNVFVPFNFQNYFFGATEIGLVPYTITTLFGITPFTMMYVYLGTVGRTIAFKEAFGTANVALILFSLLATSGLVYLIGRKTKQKLEEMTAVTATEVSKAGHHIRSTIGTGETGALPQFAVRRS
jgi:uncharacterized membrane protein YdjX (TVP38/TMEM64 family)